MSICECKLVFCSVLRRLHVGRIHSLIAKDLKFDYSKQVTWQWRAIGTLDFVWAYALVQQRKNWQLLRLLSVLIPVGPGGLFSQNWLLLYYSESLFTATCRRSSKPVLLKTLHNSQENTCAGVLWSKTGVFKMSWIRRPQDAVNQTTSRCHKLNVFKTL